MSEDTYDKHQRENKETLLRLSKVEGVKKIIIMMKGILFRQEMIRAIYNGSKTVTRRVIKPQPFIRDGVFRWTPKTGIDINLTDHSDLAIPFARYKVGETVYIKETLKADGLRQVQYLDGQHPINPLTNGWYPWQWKRDVLSSLFMPAWAARDFIRITDVKPERLNEITFEDCLAEGIVHTEQWQKVDYQAPEPSHPDDLSNEEADKEISRGWKQYTRQAYSMLWDSINKAYPFDGNWWVWRYCFNLIEDKR